MCLRSDDMVNSGLGGSFAQSSVARYSSEVHWRCPHNAGDAYLEPTAGAALWLRRSTRTLEVVDGNRRHVEDQARDGLLREGRRCLQVGALGLDFVSRRGTPSTRAGLARVAFD